jgi:hypothetical protein
MEASISMALLRAEPRYPSCRKTHYWLSQPISQLFSDRVKNKPFKTK